MIKTSLEFYRAFTFMLEVEFNESNDTFNLIGSESSVGFKIL